MIVTLAPEKIDRLIQARKNLHLSKTELSYKANVSLRTINDLESKKRLSFSETTLLALCRVLEVDYIGLLEGRSVEEIGAEKPRSGGVPEEVADFLSDLFYRTIRRVSAFPVGIISGVVIGAFLLVATVLLITTFTSKETAVGNAKSDYTRRIDWVSPEHINQWPIKGNYAVPVPPKEDILNYVYMKQIVHGGDTVDVEVKWTYDYVGTPMKYVSAYTEWEPEREIRLFKGVLRESGSKIARFQIVSPQGPGIYRMRIFNSSSFAPIPSFYGCPPQASQMNPSSAPFVEMKIEVLPD